MPALVALEELGRLVGLLTDAGGGPHIDGRWFAHPLAARTSIPTRPDDLVAAIGAVLPPLAAPPTVAGSETWYVIHEIDATASALSSRRATTATARSRSASRTAGRWASP